MFNIVTPDGMGAKLTATRSMLFAQKTKGYFIELNEHAIMVARTSGATAPFTIEEMRECPINDTAALEAIISSVADGGCFFIQYVKNRDLVYLTFHL